MRTLAKEEWSDMSLATKEMISNILLGIYPNMKTIWDDELKKQASKGFFHAVGVAVKIARSTKMIVMVSVLNDTMSGIVVLVNPTSGDGVHVCKVDLGIPMDCDEDSVISGWPAGGRVSIAVLGS